MNNNINDNVFHGENKKNPEENPVKNLEEVEEDRIRRQGRYL